MILVDDRQGSEDLLPLLLRRGVQAELARLDFGDFGFVGKGIDGADVLIGIELKRLGSGNRSDLATSLYGQRFAGHQLLGLLKPEGMYDRAWLVTEGIWREGDGGVLEVMAKGWRPVRFGSRALMMRDVESWILTQVIRGGLNHWHSSTRADTAVFLSVLYHWWTDKELQEHRSHQAIYTPPPDRVMMSPPSDFLKMVAAVDGVGWEKGRALEAAFGTPDDSLERLFRATPKDLLAVKGIGKVLAANIHRKLHGRGESTERRTAA